MHAYTHTHTNIVCTQIKEIKTMFILVSLSLQSLDHTFRVGFIQNFKCLDAFLRLFCPILGIDVYEEIYCSQLSTYATVSSTNISIRHYIKESKAQCITQPPYSRSFLTNSCLFVCFCNSVHYALKLLHYTQNRTSNINVDLPNNYN